MTTDYLNVQLDDPIMGETVTTGGVEYRVLLVKIITGVPGAVDGDVSSANPMPVTGSGGGGGGYIINRGNISDASGTLAAANTSQLLLASDAHRAYFFFQNTSAHTMWINFGSAATQSQPSVRLNSGDAFVFENTFIDTDNVYVIGTTIGDTFVCKYATVTSTIINQGTLTNASGTITTGGSSQTLAAANPLRAYFLLQNLDGSNNLYINFGSAAATTGGSIKVLPNTQFAMEGTFQSQQQINITGDSNGQVFTCKVG